MDVKNLSQALVLNDGTYRSLRCLGIQQVSLFNDLNRFESLQILGLNLNIDEINKFIPYLASQFTENNFKRLQIVITIDAKANFLRNTGPLEEDGRKILPKSIQINTTFLRIDQLKLLLDIDPHILSFNDIIVTESYRNFEYLENLSNLAKIVTISDPPIESEEAKIQEF